MQQNTHVKQQGKIPEFWNASTIPWQEFNADGTKYALLEGTKHEPGVSFTYAFFIPAGFWDAPHWHTADARIVVISGTLQLGYGEILKPAQADVFAIGSYLLVPANMSHFDGAEVDTIIIGTALGPWSTTYVKSGNAF